MIRQTVSVLLMLLVIAPAMAASPAELLRIAQKQKEESARVQQTREARFVQAHAEMKARHATSLREVRALESRAAGLRKQSEVDRTRIAELEQQLGTRGDDSLQSQRLLRVFARDLRVLLAESPVAVQAPGRDAFLAGLGEDSNNAKPQDLTKLLGLLQQELRESGRVLRMTAPVRDGGDATNETITRIGALTAVSDGRYLLHDPALGLHAAERQPGWRDRRLARAFESGSSDGLIPMRLDPTGGLWLRELANQPDPTRWLLLAVLVLAGIMATAALVWRALKRKLLPRSPYGPWWTTYNRRFFAAVGISEVHLVCLVLLLVGLFGFSLQKTTLAKQEVLEVITVSQDGPTQQPSPDPGGGAPPVRPVPSIPNLAPTSLTPVVTAPSVNVDVVMPNLSMPLASVGTAMLGKSFGGFGGSGGSGGGAGGGTGGGYGTGSMPGGKGKPLIPLSTARPQITEYAYRRGIEGWVVVVYTVGTNGRVTNIRIVDAEPKGLFEGPTVESIANWIYEPTDRPREVTQRVEFKLDDYQYNWK